MTNIIMIGALALAAQQTDTTFAVRPNGSVAVEIFTGTVKVTSWDRPQLRVVGRNSSRNGLEINTVGSRVEIQPTGMHGLGRADMELTVPRGFAVSIQGVNTPIDVQGVDGDLALETVNGDVLVRGGKSLIQAESVQGVVDIENASGRITASSMNRGVRIRNSAGEFHVEAVNGPVLLYGIDAHRVDAQTVNGPVEYDGKIYPDGVYSLASHNGRIAIAIPEDAGARVSVYTFNGQVNSSFPVEIGGEQRTGTIGRAARVPRPSRRGDIPEPPPPPEPHRGRYTFTIGSGGATIELESFSGSIELVRAGELSRRNPDRSER